MEEVIITNSQINIMTIISSLKINKLYEYFLMRVKPSREKGIIPCSIEDRVGDITLFKLGQHYDEPFDKNGYLTDF